MGDLESTAAGSAAVPEVDRGAIQRPEAVTARLEDKDSNADRVITKQRHANRHARTQRRTNTHTLSIPLSISVSLSLIVTRYLSLCSLHQLLLILSSLLAIYACIHRKRHIRHSFIHSFIQTISIASLQVCYYSEALPTQQGYCAGVSRRSAAGNCDLRTCPRSLRLKGIDSTNAPPCRHNHNFCCSLRSWSLWSSV